MFEIIAIASMGAVSFLLGRVSVGAPMIEVKISNKSDAPNEYNESLADELDPEVRNYYDHTNGLNKF
jgi:hypothetical protein